MKFKNLTIQDVCHKISNCKIDLIDCQEDADELMELLKTIENKLNIEFERINEGNQSIIKLYSKTAMTSESVARWFYENGCAEFCYLFSGELITKSNEIIEFEKQIRELTEKIKQMESERQFQFMTKDLKIMADMQRTNWKTGSEDIKITAVQLDVAVKINPNAKKANAKAKHMGSIINPKNK